MLQYKNGDNEDRTKREIKIKVFNEIGRLKGRLNNNMKFVTNKEEQKTSKLLQFSHDLPTYLSYPIFRQFEGQQHAITQIWCVKCQGREQEKRIKAYKHLV